MFPRIGDNEPLRNKVAGYIKELIRTGRLSPGDRLPPEREMAEQFGVSRTVVRDAVKTLAGEGILEVKHGIGIFVSHLDGQKLAKHLSHLLVGDQDTVEHLFEVRLVLETAAAGWAAQRRQAPDLDKIRQAIAQNRALLDLPHDRIAEAQAQSDQQFHLLVSELSANPVVVRLMKNMLDLFTEAREYTHAIPGRIRQSIKEHIAVLEAILAGDEELARQNMHFHLTSVLQSLQQLNH
ncbi:MAG: FadR/GntR family transcriptional regulator [Desulfurispora sp.]|uniref:FadR/GntR family transcriptional regulator n=1 Tax=Desulfurispora sp. TaxID=3014275 RepID=UPI00404AB650